MSRKWRVLLLLALAELLAMSLWFSASAVTPALIAEWGLDTGEAAWLTMTVQLGFVVGALLSALFNLADVWPPNRVFAVGAIVGAVFNAGLPLVATGAGSALILRFATGVSLAAVYPVGMKIMATWTREDRGLGLGLLVGALTVGSAAPHLVRGFGGIDDWRTVLLVVSGLAAFGGVLAGRFGELGPYRGPAPTFRWSYMMRSFTERPLRLANLGYLGHMWELYAMWTWIPLFLTFVYASAPADAVFRPDDPERTAAVMTFFVIGVGGISSLIAGRMADSWGRTPTTIVSMTVSGVCAVAIGGLGVGSPVIATAIALIWGATVIPDSAQFSSAVSELGDRKYMGTLLTTQTSMGFLLTLVSIRLVPAAVESVGWRWAFATLAAGPAFGTWAMWRLRQSPDAVRLAGGRR